MERDIEVKYLGRKRGRGVIALRPFYPGQVIEIAPVIFVFNGFHALKDKEGLSQWELLWGRKVAMAGGLVHFYNHDENPNVRFARNLAKGRIVVRALSYIRPDEELMHDYEVEPWWE